MQSGHISLDSSSCRKTRLRRYGRHGNRPPLCFTSLLTSLAGDVFHKLEAPFCPPSYLQQICVLMEGKGGGWWGCWRGGGWRNLLSLRRMRSSRMVQRVAPRLLKEREHSRHFGNFVLCFFSFSFFYYFNYPFRKRTFSLFILPETGYFSK